MSLRFLTGRRRRALSLMVIAVATLSGAIVATTVDAETDATTTPAAKPATETADKTAKSGRMTRELPAYTPEREAAALTFVASHHPELSPLLAGLKLSRPNEYQRAVRKLFADSERLAHNREMQPKQYDLKLREWKLDSRIQLLVARLTMERTPALEAELRSALEEQMTVRRELLTAERERTQHKITALDKEIGQIDADRARAVDEQFNRALNSAGQKKQALKANKGDGKSPETKPSGSK